MKWHSESISACMKALHTDHGGLSPAQAAKRLRQYGPNELEKPPRKPLVVRFLEQFRDCMVLILLAGAALSFFTSALSGEGEYVDAVMILVIVFVNAVIGLLQESRAQKALDVRGNHIFANGFGRPHPQAHGGRGGHGGLGLLAVVRHRAGELPQARPGRRQPQGFAFIGEKAAAIVRL